MKNKYLLIIGLFVATFLLAACDNDTSSKKKITIGIIEPIEHVAIFDEAQRAWDLQQTAKFMKKRGHANFSMSEPAFLISCLDRHADWAVIVCLVGGGQARPAPRGTPAVSLTPPVRNSITTVQ